MLGHASLSKSKNIVPQPRYFVFSPSPALYTLAESSVGIVPVQRGGIVREVGLEDIEPAVAIEVTDGRAHSGLLASIFVEGRACAHRHIGKRAVLVVVIKDARRAVTRNINVGPSVSIVIERRDAEAVMPVCLLDLRSRSDVLEVAVSRDCDTGCS